MRTLKAGLFMSVDGVVEAPNLWQFDRFDDELGAAMGGMIGVTDTTLLGRIGYEQWSEYWPTADAGDPFGSFINPVKKYVASRTLTGDLAWNNASLIEGDLLEFVRELKNSEGGDIAVVGGISLVRQLFLAGLLDTLTLLVHPVVAGTGQHLFDPEDGITRLELKSATSTSKGNLILEYGLRAEEEVQ